MTSPLGFKASTDPFTCMLHSQSNFPETNATCFVCMRCRTLNSNQYDYRPQRSWAKVTFLEASVILSTGGFRLSACWDTTPGTATAASGTHPTGMHSCYYKIHIKAKIKSTTHPYFPSLWWI